MRRKFFFFVCLLSCLVSGVVCAVAPGSSVLIAPETLAKADLKMNWQVNLPVRSDESVERMFDYAGYIYILTDDNYIFCINKKSGHIQFDKQLIAPGLPITEPVYHNNRLWFMVGNELLVLNPYNGAIKEKRKLALGGNLVEGLATGTSIQEARVSTSFTQKTNARGKAIRNYNPDRSASVTATKIHGCLFPPLGPKVPASQTLRISAVGTGSGFSRRIRSMSSIIGMLVKPPISWKMS